jgi:hypothetical protein
MAPPGTSQCPNQVLLMVACLLTGLRLSVGGLHAADAADPGPGALPPSRETTVTGSAPSTKVPMLTSGSAGSPRPPVRRQDSHPFAEPTSSRQLSTAGDGRALDEAGGQVSKVARNPHATKSFSPHRSA